MTEPVPARVVARGDQLVAAVDHLRDQLDRVVADLRALEGDVSALVAAGEVSSRSETIDEADARANRLAEVCRVSGVYDGLDELVVAVVDATGCVPRALFGG